MGILEASTGNNGRNGLVKIAGYQDSLSLDARGRFRVPDHLASILQRELGRIQASAAGDAPPATFQRLCFYLVPGTEQRIFLYPTPNIRLAIQRFERPPAGMDAQVVRQARDYFYQRMRFVEADKQNRVAIPEGLREHADIDEQVQQITLVAQNYWLTLGRAELIEQRAAQNLEAFRQAAPDLLDPVYRSETGSPAEPGEPDPQA